jgi:sorting nexin-29
LNNVLYAKVKTGKQLSSEFKVNQGSRHGDAISPLLFNIVLENAIRRSKVDSLRTTFNKYRQIIAYVDVVFVMGRRLQDFEEVFTSVVEKTGKMGTEINKIRQNL